MALIQSPIKTAERLEELSDFQRDRVLKYLGQERVKLDAKIMDHNLARTLNETIKEYRYTLLELQKIRFELGIDDFKGPQSHTVIRGLSQTNSLPDGSSVQKQIFEAINTIEQIFDARSIPRHTR
jgi:hypothetical protein